MAQRHGSSTGSSSGYFEWFHQHRAPSLASNGKPVCQMKKSSREPACPAQRPSWFRCSCTGLAIIYENMLAQSIVLQWAPRRKVWSWCSKKALKRNKAQLKRQFAWTGISHQSWQWEASDWDRWHPSVRKWDRLVIISRQRGIKLQRKMQEAERVSRLPIILSPSLWVFSVQRVCASRCGLYSHQQACKNSTCQSPSLLGLSHHYQLNTFFFFKVRKKTTYFCLFLNNFP